MHTFYPLIPPEKYFAEHPEWFSEIDGKRTTEHAQLCLTNEDMRKELVKNLKERLRNNPAATIASVSQNDWIGNCKCKNCAAIEQEEGSPAGLMLRFVNAVAADIEQEFPNVAISTLAYQYTRKPPKITKPRDNVIVQLCSIECSFCKPLADERNKAFRDDIVGWSQMCKRLYIWDYTTNFRHHIMPHPNLRVLGPNVKFFADHNVKGIFEQGAYTTSGAEMAELRAWVLAKLLWDPSRDGEALTNEFIEGYYGPAAPHIKAYLKVTHDAVEQSGDWLGCFEQDHRQVPELRHALSRLAMPESGRGGGAGQSRPAIPRAGGPASGDVHVHHALERHARGRQDRQRRLAHAAIRQRHVRPVHGHRQARRTSRGSTSGRTASKRWRRPWSRQRTDLV